MTPTTAFVVAANVTRSIFVPMVGATRLYIHIFATVLLAWLPTRVSAWLVLEPVPVGSQTTELTVGKVAHAEIPTISRRLLPETVCVTSSVMPSPAGLMDTAPMAQFWATEIPQLIVTDPAPGSVEPAPLPVAPVPTSHRLDWPPPTDSEVA